MILNWNNLPVLKPEQNQIEKLFKNIWWNQKCPYICRPFHKRNYKKSFILQSKKSKMREHLPQTIFWYKIFLRLNFLRIVRFSKFVKICYSHTVLWNIEAAQNSELSLGFNSEEYKLSINIVSLVNETKLISCFCLSCFLLFNWKPETRNLKPFTYNGEFDPGSGWTLAAGLTHASRTVTG